MKTHVFVILLMLAIPMVGCHNPAEKGFAANEEESISLAEDDVVVSLTAAQEQLLDQAPNELSEFIADIHKVVSAALIVGRDIEDFPHYAKYHLQYRVEDVRESESNVKAILSVKENNMTSKSRIYTMEDVLYFDEPESVIIQDVGTIHYHNEQLGKSLVEDMFAHSMKAWQGAIEFARDSARQASNLQYVNKVSNRGNLTYESYFTLSRTTEGGLTVKFLGIAEGSHQFSKKNSTVHYIKIQFYTDTEAEEARQAQAGSPVAHTGA